MAEVKRYVRYERNGETSFGVLEDDRITPISGNLFGSREPSGEAFDLSGVKLRYPIEPAKVLCVGLNYASHLQGRPSPAKPEIFYKPPTALQDPGGDIVIPEGAKDVHYEAELVVVVGKRAHDVSPEEAADCILGYTCGNDVSDRNWQNGSQGDKADTQWWRAKGSDTFGPFGPAIAVGLDYENSRISLRLNGDVKQTQMLSDLIFKPADIVSFISRYVTLEPGDIIFTGTPGKTTAMKPGDTVEVEIEGIGVLENHVRAES